MEKPLKNKNLSFFKQTFILVYFEYDMKIIQRITSL